MQSVKRTRREISRLVLTITMSCMMAVLLASCETTSTGTTDVPQPRPHEHTHPESATREDVKSEIQTMVGPVVESLVQETSAAVGENRRKYPIEPPSKSNAPGPDIKELPPEVRAEVRDGKRYFEVQDGTPNDPMRSIPFYCPALREPVLRVDKPEWRDELPLAGAPYSYIIEVTNISTNQILLDVVVHEILPGVRKGREQAPVFDFDSAHYVGGYGGDSIKESTFKDDASGKILPSVVFGWTDNNRFFRPGETRTVEIRGKFKSLPENTGKTLRDKIERQQFDVGGEVTYYTAAAYILGGCIPQDRPPVVAALVGEFVDLHDPLRREEYFRHRGMLEEAGEQLVGSHLFVAIANQGEPKPSVGRPDDPLKIVDLDFQLFERRPPELTMLDDQTDPENKLTINFGKEVKGLDGNPDALRTARLTVYEAGYERNVPHICSIKSFSPLVAIDLGDLEPSDLLPHRPLRMADLNRLSNSRLDWLLNPQECYIMVFSGYKFAEKPVIYHSSLEVVTEAISLRTGQPQPYPEPIYFAVDDLEPSTIRELATVVRPGEITFP